MTDLSKSFDCIDLKVLFVKIHAYGFDTKSLRFIDIYLAGRKQGKRISIEYWILFSLTSHKSKMQDDITYAKDLQLKPYYGHWNL